MRRCRSSSLRQEQARVSLVVCNRGRWSRAFIYIYTHIYSTTRVKIWRCDEPAASTVSFAWKRGGWESVGGNNWKSMTSDVARAGVNSSSSAAASLIEYYSITLVIVESTLGGFPTFRNGGRCWFRNNETILTSSNLIVCAFLEFERLRFLISS